MYFNLVLKKYEIVAKVNVWVADVCATSQFSGTRPHHDKEGNKWLNKVYKTDLTYESVVFRSWKWDGAWSRLSHHTQFMY